MFALMAGGVMFGFVGIFIAVPAAAVIGVLSRHSLQRYMQSRLYLGAAAAALAEGHPEISADAPGIDLGKAGPNPQSETPVPTSGDKEADGKGGSG